MHISSDTNKVLFLGIDGGGTKCKAIITNQEHEVLGTGIAGPGNPLHGFKQATESIIASAQAALIDAGLAHVALHELTAGVGLAGVNLPVLFKQMSNWKHPFKQMFLATDLLIACLGAHNGQDGAVMITGTGSCGFSFIHGQSFIIGAHGFPHGDKGSGAWFGLQAAEQVLLSLDGLIVPTSLNEALLAHHKCKSSLDLVEAIAGKPAAFYARMANLVFDCAEQGDQVALAIIHEGADYINDMANKLWDKKPPRMSMIGGLSIKLIPWLDKQIQDQLSTPCSPPELGSIIFAQQQLSLLQSA
jgi:glucosamine kinase